MAVKITGERTMPMFNARLPTSLSLYDDTGCGPLVNVLKLNLMTPKEITIDPDNNNAEIAHFSYYDGISYVRENGQQFTTSYRMILTGDYYMVCCGDVMLRVEPTDFPEIPRRTI